MIKGCQKRIIQIKDTKNPVFEEAYLVLRSGYSDTVCEKDIISEATSIINRYSKPQGTYKKARKSLKNILWFISGAIIGSSVFLCVYLLFL